MVLIDDDCSQQALFRLECVDSPLLVCVWKVETGILYYWIAQIVGFCKSQVYHLMTGSLADKGIWMEREGTMRKETFYYQLLIPNPNSNVEVTFSSPQFPFPSLTLYNTQIQMDLRCGICNKDYDEFQRLPKVIPQCGHSYCQKCIKKKLQERKNVFVCPIDNQSHIFRRENDELPRNFAIINAMKEKKSQSISKNRQNIIIKKYNDDLRNSSLVCEEHQAPKEFICLDDQKSICSHCALFGSHKGHKLEKITKPKMSEGLTDLFDKAMVGMESLSVEAVHVTQSPNIFLQSFQNLKKVLRASIKQSFKGYHQMINRRQAYVEKQLDEIVRGWQNEADGLSDRISNCCRSIVDIKEHLNLLNPDKEQISRNQEVLGMELEDLIDKMKSTEKDISKTKQEISIKCREYQAQYRKRLESAKFFKIQEVAVDMSGSTNQAESRSRSIEDHNASYNLKVRPPSHSINESREQNVKKDTNYLPPKHHTATNLIKLGSTAKSRLITTTSHDFADSISKSNHKEDHSMQFMHSRKCSPSPIQKQKQEKRTSGRAQVRKKISNVIQVISKCETSTLQLLGLEIKDYYLQQIFDYIMKSGRKFGVIKFVKNDITDEGLEVILEAVKNYQYLHTLNLTSNQLTEHSLDLIINFTVKNKILKNFYLRNNLINIQKTKEKKKQMFEQGLNIFY